MENNTQRNKRLTEMLIVIVLILNMIFGVRVLFDISETGIVYKDISPDKQYEIIMHREKMPKSFEISEVLTTIELYKKDTRTLISYFEWEADELGECPEISVEWSEEGVLVKIYTNVWLEYSHKYVILPYQ